MERFEVTQASTLTTILWDEDEIFAVVALAGGGTRPMRTRVFRNRRHFKPRIPGDIYIMPVMLNRTAFDHAKESRKTANSCTRRNWRRYIHPRRSPG
jgi:hypothetical protein